jgi:hypothetical protein
MRMDRNESEQKDRVTIFFEILTVSRPGTHGRRFQHRRLSGFSGTGSEAMG